MKKSFLILFLFVFSLNSFAQTEDLGSWMTFTLAKDLGDKFQVGIDQEFRLKNNISEINLLYTNIGASYKVADFFKIGVTYRFIDKHKDDGFWGLRHRVYTDFSFKFKPGKFNLGARLRVQSEWRGAGYESIYGNIPEVYIRNQYKIGYKASEKIEPYVGVEVRWQVQNPRIPYHDGFDRTRFFGGANYEINKKNMLGLYFLNQYEWNVIEPETLYIIGIEYTITL